MTQKSVITEFTEVILPSVLNSYSVIFFFNNRLLASVLMVVSFFNVYAGLSGLVAVLTTVLIAYYMGLDRVQLRKGLFSFNALLTGVGMGTFFDSGVVFFSLLILVALFTLILSVTLGNWFGKYGLPVLSIPFVFCFWFVVMPSSQFENLGLTQRNIYWMNDLYSIGGGGLLSMIQKIDELPLSPMLDMYLRSLSSIFFQDNVVSGFLIALGILICSRIAFSLTIVGFLSAYFFAVFTGSEAASINHYNIGANYIMVAIAIGGFFVIPSRHSYVWTVLLVPLTSLVLIFMTKFFETFQLPVFSLPFSFIVISFLYFLYLRVKPSGLITTPVQYYSPEVNLYTFINNKERLANAFYFPLYMPFWGEWTVTQGHDGKHTHKGDWGKAFDFSITDDAGKTYQNSGKICEDFYCYNKPVLAPADGFVEEIIDYVDDNEIGKVDTARNWGNTIVIRHATGLYTQISHLKKGSFRVVKGDFVKRGDMIASCGNSGRSPEPHIHFQVQSSPTIGARTINYPMAYFRLNENGKNQLVQFGTLTEGVRVSGIESNLSLQSAFDIAPNTELNFAYTDKSGAIREERWIAYTDATNNKYLYCEETSSSAFYISDSSIFYFTTFYGDKSSLLYAFYLSAYKIFLGDLRQAAVTDGLPINAVGESKISKFVHDFVAPFYHFMKVTYSVTVEENTDLFQSEKMVLLSDIKQKGINKELTVCKAKIVVENNRIQSFTFQSNNRILDAKCIKN